MKGWHKEKRFGNYDHVLRMQVKQAMEREERMFRAMIGGFDLLPRWDIKQTVYKKPRRGEA